MKYKLFVFVFLSSVFSYGQFSPANYMSAGYTLPYQVMFPENYDESRKYPLIILLHGAGERGDDNQKQLTYGKDFLADNFYSSMPAIVIVPQCPLTDYWSNVERHTIGNNITFDFGVTKLPTRSMQTLIMLIENYMRSGKVDTDRIYVGGMSMGAMGTYELLWRMPDTFVAAFAICGGVEVNRLRELETPVWIFHGDSDDVVPVEFSREIYKTLKDEGNDDVKYTEYPGVGHNSWVNVFREPELATWLFGHKK